MKLLAFVVLIDQTSLFTLLVLRLDNGDMTTSMTVLDFTKNTLFLLMGFILISCENNQRKTSDLTDGSKSAPYQRLNQAASEPQNWLSHGRTYKEQRFSPLGQINTENIEELGLDWFFDIDTQRGQEATPLVVDGTMYISTAWSMVKALDAKTGKLLWEYDPEVERAWGVYACCDVVNRGVAFWDGQIFVGTLDGYLVALDAETGTQAWKILTVDKSKPYTITGAPRVVKGKVLIGNGGGEYGVRGYISAYDVKNGEMAWRFYTVPGNPADGFESSAIEMAAKTWTGEWWSLGGGGTVWDSMAYDPDLDLLYIGVGNGSPWDQTIRSPEGGDNLFLSSIVALRPDSGEYVWHYQTTPGETWDFTATQQITLADIEIDGTTRKVLMQAPKNGFFYVLDRATGEFTSGEAFTPMTWATGLDKAGRPIENPKARYKDEPFVMLPGPSGAHNWHSMSYSPETGLVYIPAQEVFFPMIKDENFKPSDKAWNLGISFDDTPLPTTQEGLEEINKILKGYLLAWDPVTQKEAWRHNHVGISNGGALSTAGNLVFQGTAKGQFNAFNAQDGKLRWSVPTDTGVIAAPMSYEIEGEQYIAIVVGWGGVFGLGSGDLSKVFADVRNNSRVLVFKLGSKAELPASEAYQETAVAPPAQFASSEQVAAGKKLYNQYCFQCHGAQAIGGGLIQDIRYGGVLPDAGLWNEVVLKGLLADQGMANFGAILSEEQAAQIRAYVIEESHIYTKAKSKE